VSLTKQSTDLLQIIESMNDSEKQLAAQQQEIINMKAHHQKELQEMVKKNEELLKQLNLNLKQTVDKEVVEKPIEVIKEVIVEKVVEVPVIVEKVVEKQIIKEVVVEDKNQIE